MHVNKVHHVTTINRVAEDLGEDEDCETSPMKWRSKTAPSGSMESENMASKPSLTSESKT